MDLKIEKTNIDVVVTVKGAPYEKDWEFDPEEWALLCAHIVSDYKVVVAPNETLQRSLDACKNALREAEAKAQGRVDTYREVISDLVFELRGTR